MRAYSFMKHAVDWKSVDDMASRYSDKDNVILIGLGGQSNPIHAYNGSLCQKTPKNLFMMETQDPDYILYVKGRCKKEDTVVIVSSKSGNTSTVLHLLQQFMDYDVVTITEEGKGKLFSIGQEKGWPNLPMPKEIGGRYSGTCESTYLPLSILGYDCRSIHKGATDFYSDPDMAKDTAKFMFDTFGRRLVEVYMPVYSKGLQSFCLMITQLMHETVCKEGKGQTVLCMAAPDCQHHTNQRFFGGPKNMALITVSADSKEDIPYGDMTYSKLLENERIGLEEEAHEKKMPVLSLRFSYPDERELGRFMALWQLVSVLLAEMHGVDPFNQPEVEGSKNRTRQLNGE